MSPCFQNLKLILSRLNRCSRPYGIKLICSVNFFVALQLNAAHGLLILQVFVIHNDLPQPVGLLWASDQLVAETVT